MNRIYLVGSHSTGKTTLARWVSQRYKLPMLPEAARMILSEMEASLDSLRTDLDLVNTYQEKVFKKQLEMEYVLKGGFVSDRAFDNIAYAAEHSNVTNSLVTSVEFQGYMKWIKEEGKVFFLRPHQELLKNDGVREKVIWESVIRIDGMIKLMLEMYSIPYIPINCMSMQERVRTVEFVLGDMK